MTATRSSIFRTIHTIMGTCGFSALEARPSSRTPARTVLEAARDGRIRLNQERTTALSLKISMPCAMLGSIGASGHDGNETHPELIELLTALQSDGAAPAAVAPAAKPVRWPSARSSCRA